MVHMNQAGYLVIAAWFVLGFAILADSLPAVDQITLCFASLALFGAALDLTVIHPDRKPTIDESEYDPPRDRLGL